MERIMLDLETMGTAPTSAIIAIGAVKFDAVTVTSKFYRTVSLESSLAAGLTIDAATEMWWLRQDTAARERLQKDPKTLTRALFDFSSWLGSCEEVWGNGAAFDNAILENAFRCIALPQPWPFWGDRCYRTLNALYPEVPLVRVGTFHRAIDDAETQALHLLKIEKHLRGE